jgi:HSP20 family protein
MQKKVRNIIDNLKNVSRFCPNKIVEHHPNLLNERKKGGNIMIYRRLFDFPTFGARSPFQELDNMRRQLDQVMNFYSPSPRRSMGAGVFPQLNVTEDGDKFRMRAELPGIKSDDLDIQATGKTITISGERKIPIEHNNARYHRREREAGKFSRVIAMPSEIDADRIEAKLQNGILTVMVPKAEAAKPRQIKVS